MVVVGFLAGHAAHGLGHPPRTVGAATTAASSEPVGSAGDGLVDPVEGVLVEGEHRALVAVFARAFGIGEEHVPMGRVQDFHQTLRLTAERRVVLRLQDQNRAAGRRRPTAETTVSHSGRNVRPWSRSTEPCPGLSKARQLQPRRTAAAAAAKYPSSRIESPAFRAVMPTQRNCSASAVPPDRSGERFSDTGRPRSAGTSTANGRGRRSSRVAETGRCQLPKQSMSGPGWPPQSHGSTRRTFDGHRRASASDRRRQILADRRLCRRRGA